MLYTDNETCTGCNTCAEECPNGCLAVEGETVSFNPAKCNMCGHCMAVCPCDCIYIDGDGYDCGDVEDLSFASRPTQGQIRNMLLYRRSVRRFTDIDVTEEELDCIIEAGKYSPTAKNAQGNVFMIITDPEKKEEMLGDIARILLDKGNALEAEIPGLAAFFRGKANRYFEQGRDEIFYGAPLVIFVFADSSEDGAVCAANMGFMAQSLQLGYCFAQLPTDAFSDEAFREKWKAPEGKKCVLALLIGNALPDYFCSVTRKNPEIIRF